MNLRSTVFVFCAAAALALSGSLFAQTAGRPQQTPVTPPADTTEQIVVQGHADQSRIIRDFVKSYAASAQTIDGQLARWKSGVCPLVTGLAPDLNVFIAGRVKAVAALVGAPVNAKPACKANLVVFVSPAPQTLMDSIRKKTLWLLGSHYAAQEAALATMRSPIQAWYATETEDDKGNRALDDIGGLRPSSKCTFYVPCPGSEDSHGNSNQLCPMEADSCISARASRLTSGLKSDFVMVTIVADQKQIVGLQAGALADYIAMLGLAQTKAFEGCRDLPSITNLMSPSCDAGNKAEALTASDVAYLKGLYQMDPTATADVQNAELARWMTRNLENPK